MYIYDDHQSTEMDQTVGSINPFSNLHAPNTNSDVDAGHGNPNDADVDSHAGSLMTGTQAAQVLLDYTTFRSLVINMFLVHINILYCILYYFR